MARIDKYWRTNAEFITFEWQAKIPIDQMELTSFFIARSFSMGLYLNKFSLQLLSYYDLEGAKSRGVESHPIFRFGE